MPAGRRPGADADLDGGPVVVDLVWGVVGGSPAGHGPATGGSGGVSGTVLDELLAAERVQHRRLQGSGEVDELLVRARAPGPGQDGDPCRRIQDFGRRR